MRKTVFSALVAAAIGLPAADLMAQSADANVMAGRIGSRLKESGQLRDYRIGIEFADGVVHLTGNVTSLEQAEAAVRLTRDVRGVSDVVNELKVSGGPSRPAAFQQPRSAPEPQALPSHQAQRIPSPQRRALPPAAYANRAQSLPRSAGNHPMGRPMNGPNSMQSLAANRRMPPRQVAQQPRQMTRQVPAQMVAARQPAGPAVYRPAQPGQRPMPINYMPQGPGGMGPMPAGYVPGGNVRAASYDSAQMPGYAWPSYSSYPNYGALSYPRQYSPTAWPYIGPFYPYPQVPLGWRKVALEWDDGWWFLDFSDRHSAH